MRKIMTVMSRNVTGIHTAQLVTIMHMSYAHYVEGRVYFGVIQTVDS